jgi:Transglycosylase-like domain
MLKRAQTRVPAHPNDGAFVGDHRHTGGDAAPRGGRRRFSKRTAARTVPFLAVPVALALLLAPAALDAAAPDVRAPVDGGTEPLVVRFRPPDAPTPDEELALARLAERDRRVVAFVAAVQFKQALEYATAVEQARQAEAARAEAARAEAEQATVRRASSATTSSRSSSRSASRAPSRPAPAAEQGSGRCGGDLPPCSVMQRESGGNIRAENPSSSASGKWQFIDGTWNGYGGYSHAADAPEEVQDAKARALWAGGAGCGHWTQTASGC